MMSCNDELGEILRQPLTQRNDVSVNSQRNERRAKSRSQRAALARASMAPGDDEAAAEACDACCSLGAGQTPLTV